MAPEDLQSKVSLVLGFGKCWLVKLIQHLLQIISGLAMTGCVVDVLKTFGAELQASWLLHSESSCGECASARH